MESTLFIQFVARNPRLSIALPDGLLRALERWAEAEGNKPTSLATFLLEKAIREAIEAGKVPPEAPDEKVPKLDQSKLKTFLTQLACGESPTEGDLTTLAHALDVEAQILIDLRDRVQRSSNNQ